MKKTKKILRASWCSRPSHLSGTAVVYVIQNCLESHSLHHAVHVARVRCVQAQLQRLQDTD